MRVAFIALTFFISVDVSRSFFLCFDDDLRASDDTVYNDIRVFFFRGRGSQTCALHFIHSIGRHGALKRGVSFFCLCVVLGEGKGVKGREGVKGWAITTPDKQASPRLHASDFSAFFSRHIITLRYSFTHRVDQ